MYSLQLYETRRFLYCYLKFHFFFFFLSFFLIWPTSFSFEENELSFRLLSTDNPPITVYVLKLLGVTEMCKNSFFPRTIIGWNNLDDSVVRADTVEGFKKAVSQWEYRSPQTRKPTQPLKSPYLLAGICKCHAFVFEIPWTNSYGPVGKNVLCLYGSVSQCLHQRADHMF